MELFSAEFFSALGAIIIIDLILAGDNAIVIALAARNVAPDMRRRVIVLGTLGAILVRTVMTLGVVWLLKVPGLLFIGGALLVYIAYKLVAPAQNDDGNQVATKGFWGAMQTIIVADAVMGVDNVLAVAGAAHGSFMLVVLGLLISIPFIVWGSHFVLKSIEHHPTVIYIGAGVLAWTAAKMLTSDPLMQTVYSSHPPLIWLLYAAIIGGVLGYGYLRNRQRSQLRRATES